MSASPRKLLRRAADALGQVEEIAARYPEARAELEAVLGRAGVEALRRAAADVAAAAAKVDGHRAANRTSDDQRSDAGH